MKNILPCLFLSLIMLQQAYAVKLSDLSPEAQAMLPKQDTIKLTLLDGRVMRGLLINKDEKNITIEIQKSKTMKSRRMYPLLKVKSQQVLDPGLLYGEKLLERWVIDPEKSLTKEEYEQILGMFKEYDDKCHLAWNSPAVKEREGLFADEYDKILHGMKKIKGEWYTAVKAAVVQFGVFTDEMKVLEERRDFLANLKVKEAYEKLEDDRRAVARSLPQIMEKNVPELLEKKEFDEAVAETTAFMQFWLSLVVDSEGPAKQGLLKMDFGYMLRTQDEIMAAYSKAGQGNAEKPATLKTPKNMIYVPGGYFLMGGRTEDGRLDYFPMHIVYTDPYLIDKYEVSNAEYRKFVEAIQAKPDASIEHNDAPPLKKHDAEGFKHPNLAAPRQPVVGVDWFDAYAYAKWKGKRLPTEAEWEKAARGMDARKYPWGDADPMTKMVTATMMGRNIVKVCMDRQHADAPRKAPSGGCSCVKEEALPPPPAVSIIGRTVEVNKVLPIEASLELRDETFEWDPQAMGNVRDTLSAYGLVHMADNAAEWVHDYYDKTHYTTSVVVNPQGPESGKLHVYRGGCYLAENATTMTVYWRGRPMTPQFEAGMDYRNRPIIGFRCAKSLDISLNK